MTNNNIAKILDLRFPFTRLLLLLFTFSFLLVSCDTTEPRNNGVLTLTPLDASCTEVWLKVENDANLIGVELTLFRDKQEYGSFTLTGTDTILFYGYLQPSTNYTFFAQINGIPSNTVNITTMDTTSHDFTWQTFTFGDGSGGSSYLNDVAIVDENNIWAVGMIYDNGEKYNAVHWDGSEWELLAIDWDGVVSELRTILAFSANDIILGNVNLLHWNGNHFIQMDIPNEVFLAYQNAMWGLSSDDFYVVGNGGNIAHYQNGYWKKIESRTDVDLTDIYGSDDGNYIWTCGWDYSGNPSIIISIQSNQSKTIWDGTASYSWKYSGKISSLWYDGQEFWSGGNKFFHHSPINGKGEDIVYEGVSNGWVGFEQKAFIFKIRGRGPNSIFIAGDEGIVWHYNGFSFRMYSEFYEDNGSRRFLGIDIKRNLVTMCGWIDGKAWIINSY